MKEVAESAVTRGEFEEYQRKTMAILNDIESRLKALTLEEEEPTLRASGSYCPQCGVAVKDLYAHLKSEPEKHGLVKTVEVVKKTYMKDILDNPDHDIFDCKDCRPLIDERLSKKGLAIVSKSSEHRCPKCGGEMRKPIFGDYFCPDCSWDWL